MKKESIKYLFLLVVVILFAVFVYPTVYHYDKLEQKYPVRINRLTGKTEVLYRDGWKDITQKEKASSVNIETNNNTNKVVRLDDIEKSNKPEIQKITKKSDLIPAETKNLEIDENISISKINFSDRYVTGIVKNISDKRILFSSLNFETYDKSGNVLPKQPNSGEINGGSVFNFINSGETTIFSVYLNSDAHSVGNYKVKLTYSLGY